MLMRHTSCGVLPEELTCATASLHHIRGCIWLGSCHAATRHQPAELAGTHQADTTCQQLRMMLRQQLSSPPGADNPSPAQHCAQHKLVVSCLPVAPSDLFGSFLGGPAAYYNSDYPVIG